MRIVRSAGEIDEAIAAGAISADAANALRAHVDSQRALPTQDEEQFRLITGFNDIFVSIAAAILLFAVGFIGQWVGQRTGSAIEGDGPLPLTQIWRDELTGELHEVMDRMQSTEEAKIGITSAHIDAVRFTTTPKGLSAAAMNASQQEILKALLDTYLGRLPNAVAEREMAKVTGASFPSLHLAWAGSLDPGRPHYYRIQGHRLLVEYDNTTRDGNHVHSVWRDPVGDFGMDALGVHRREGH
jgi:hypothetical protein